jgi:UDP-N-acetylmuramyl pentapeptide phosphotransferase/UDP-N-acetylglucosamine-1-phosphate transferase
MDSAAVQPILTSAAVALAVSCSVALLLVLTRRWHLRLTGDSLLHMPQKIHREPVPRVGGLAIVSGFVAGLVHLVWFGAVPPAITSSTAVILLVGLAPIAAIGFTEDLTKRIGARQRLLWLALGSVIALQMRHMYLQRIGVPALDPLFENWGFALAFSVFACVGAANAYNIVDGLNGLLAGVALITLAAIAWVAGAVGDQKVFALTVLLAVATLGWLPFNWPHARLFAGDGGAYALGFLTAVILLLLVHRNPQVSPWFGLTAAALPVWETLYSMWRRSRTGLAAMEPDQAHLHQLVRTRLHWLLKHRALRKAGVWASDWTPPAEPPGPTRVTAPNGLCSPLLWCLHASAVGCGAAFHDDTSTQAATFAVFALLYVALHQRLVRSRTKYKLALAG